MTRIEIDGSTADVAEAVDEFVKKLIYDGFKVRVDTDGSEPLPSWP